MVLIASCYLDLQQGRAYIAIMSDRIPFAGTIVRTEPGGFGIIHFDEPLGPCSNSYGIISSSTGTNVPTFTALRRGARVRGMAEADSRHELANVATFVIEREAG